MKHAGKSNTKENEQKKEELIKIKVCKCKKATQYTQQYRTKWVVGIA